MDLKSFITGYPIPPTLEEALLPLVGIPLITLGYTTNEHEVWSREEIDKLIIASRRQGEAGLQTLRERGRNDSVLSAEVVAAFDVKLPLRFPLCVALSAAFANLPGRLTRLQPWRSYYTALHAAMKDLPDHTRFYVNPFTSLDQFYCQRDIGVSTDYMRDVFPRKYAIGREGTFWNPSSVSVYEASGVGPIRGSKAGFCWKDEVLTQKPMVLRFRILGASPVATTYLWGRGPFDEYILVPPVRFDVVSIQQATFKAVPHYVGAGRPSISKSAELCAERQGVIVTIRVKDAPYAYDEPISILRVDELAASITDLTEANQALRDQVAQLQQQVGPETAFIRWRPHVLSPGVVPASDASRGRGELCRVQRASALFTLAESLCRVRGSFLPAPSPVGQGFQLAAVDAVCNSAIRIAGYEARQQTLCGLRQDGGAAFNHLTRNFNADQLNVLGSIREFFQEKSPHLSMQFPNTLYVFQGPRVEAVDSICRNGLVALRDTDAGYFGLGCYTTLNIEYAARYARGDFDMGGPFRARSDRENLIPVIMFAATVGMAYPVTPTNDYRGGREDFHGDCFGSPLKRGFDCHVACVSQTAGFEAVGRADCQYVELVIDQESQLLPVAVLWFQSSF